MPSMSPVSDIHIVVSLNRYSYLCRPYLGHLGLRPGNLENPSGNRGFFSQNAGPAVYSPGYCGVDYKNTEERKRMRLTTAVHEGSGDFARRSYLELQVPLYWLVLICL